MARYWQWKWKRTISKGYKSTWIILLKHRYVFYLRYKAIKKKSILEFMALHCHGKVVQLQNIYQLYPKKASRHFLHTEIMLTHSQNHNIP